MPFTIELDASGMWAWLANTDTGVRAEIVADITVQSQAAAYIEWCNRSGVISLGERFRTSAFTTKSLRPRSIGYQRRQERWLGAVLPYTSPREPDLLKLAKALTSPHRTARSLLRALKAATPHASVLVRVQGGGFNVHSRGAKRIARTTLTLPGMRILNRISGPVGNTYRKEFLGFDRGGRADGQWIAGRANELALMRLFAILRNQQRRRLGGNTP